MTYFEPKKEVTLRHALIFLVVMACIALAPYALGYALESWGVI